MSYLYHNKKLGDILRLHMAVGDVEPNSYVLLSIDDTCCLSVLGENRNGDLSATNRHVYVPLADLSLFVETELRVERTASYAV